MGLIAFVGAVAAASATGAFFSDTETSTGNTFTAGAIDLLVDSEAHYNGSVCTLVESDYIWVGGDEYPVGLPCSGTWTETDLGPTYQFFTLGDIKPGDEGENTLSLHVEDNDAYMCAVISNVTDEENDVTEPETDLGDSGPVGELSQELNFFAWEDNGEGDGEAGNNIWDAGEPALLQGPASGVLDGVVYEMYGPGSPLAGDTTTYVGLYWCYGDITVDENTLSCSGESVTNVSQTDSLTADISFYVEQARNNEEFECPTLQEFVPDTTPGPVSIEA